jgi:hypothetical protein
MIETWRACGLDVDHPNLKFLWSSKEINADGDKYWGIVLVSFSFFLFSLF